MYFSVYYLEGIKTTGDERINYIIYIHKGGFFIMLGNEMFKFSQRALYQDGRVMRIQMEQKAREGRKEMAEKGLPGLH